MTMLERPKDYDESMVWAPAVFSFQKTMCFLLEHLLAALLSYDFSVQNRSQAQSPECFRSFSLVSCAVGQFWQQARVFCLVLFLTEPQAEAKSNPESLFYVEVKY